MRSSETGTTAWHPQGWHKQALATPTHHDRSLPKPAIPLVTQSSQLFALCSVEHANKNFDSSGEPGPHAKGVNHLETP